MKIKEIKDIVNKIKYNNNFMGYNVKDNMCLSYNQGLRNKWNIREVKGGEVLRYGVSSKKAKELIKNS